MKSLWGDLSDIEEIKTPQEILNEQASYLSSSTNGIVLAKLVRARITALGEKFMRDDIFKFDFLLTSPKMSSYSYRAFGIEHDIRIYPVIFYIEESIDREIRHLCITDEDDEEIIANNEKEFLDILSNILSSKSIIKVVSSLINLSKSL